MMDGVSQTRPSWDEYYLSLARAVATRADCTRSAVGAVIVSPDNRVISTGYNGSPPGAISCLAGQCPRGRASYEEIPALTGYGNCIALHAERNAILYATVSLLGSTIYITRPPCPECSQLIVAFGIERIITDQLVVAFGIERVITD